MWGDLPAFERLDGRSPAPVCVAVSGGGDSLAALVHTCAWAERAGRPVLALSVDHGLQPQSAGWTALAGEMASSLGADFRALKWAGEKPATGIPAAARLARHALLAEAARAAGARVIVTGHTADDQAENAALRQGALREWSASPVWPEGREMFLLRPLLDVSRAAIRSDLLADGWRWVDDPANEDLRHPRARARRMAEAAHAKEARLVDPAGSTPLLEPSPLEVTAISSRDQGREAFPSPRWGRDRVGVRTPSLEEARVRRRPVGVHSGSPGYVSGSARSPTLPHRGEGSLIFDRSIRGRPLAIAAVCAGGGSRLPRLAEVERIVGRLRSGEQFVATLCGSRIDAGKDVVFTREPGRKGLPVMRLTPGEPLVWDGRYELEALDEGLTVRPLAGHASRLPAGQTAALRRIDARARGSLPLIERADGTAVCPLLAGNNAVRVRPLVRQRFLSAYGAIETELQACDDLCMANEGPASYLGASGLKGRLNEPA